MGFKWILIGFIFLLPIDINGYDLLPDFLGYGFIAYGLYIIRKFNFKFKLAQIPLAYLFFYSIFYFILEFSSLFRFSLPLPFIQMLYQIDFSRLGLTLMNIFYLLFTVLIFYGVSENASKYGFNGLAERAKNLCILLIFYTVIISIPMIAVLPSIIYTILIYIIQIFELFVIIDARQNLE